MQFYSTYTYLSLDYECLYIFVRFKDAGQSTRDVQKYAKSSKYPLRRLQWLRQIEKNYIFSWKIRKFVRDWKLKTLFGTFGDTEKFPRKLKATVYSVQRDKRISIQNEFYFPFWF